MGRAPLFEVTSKAGGSIFATQDYLGERYFVLGDLTYYFVRLEQVQALYYTKSKGEFFIDFRDANDRVLTNGSVDSKKKLEELKEELLKVKSDIRIQKA